MNTVSAELAPLPVARATPKGGRGVTRSRLLAAAAEVLVAGDGQFEMADVARQAGLSVGLSYHYFGSKAGLLAALVDAFYERYDQAVMQRNPLPGAGWAARERARLEATVEFHYADPMAPLILTRLSREPDVAAVEARWSGRHIDLAVHNLRLAQARREIPAELDPILMAAFIIGGLRQTIAAALMRPDRQPAEVLVQQIWTFIAATVRLRPESMAASTRFEGEG